MVRDYDAKMIYPRTWRRPVQVADGHWRMIWNIDLETRDMTGLDAVTALATKAEAGFTPHLHVQGASNLLVEVDTTRWGLEDDYFGLTFRLFHLIDSRLGRIRFIQGDPREWWSSSISQGSHIS